MSDATMLEELVSSLLYEGYALYPYTPTATKNATPTPFGIVYPPAYAAAVPGAFDHARVECEARPAPGATLSATLHMLVPYGHGHEAERRRVDLGPAAPGERVSTEFPGGRFTLRSEALTRQGGVAPRGALGDFSSYVRKISHDPGDGNDDREGDAVRVRACVHNTAEVDAALDRREALAHSLISTHIVITTSGGRFRSPLDSGGESVNIWPVLATPSDDAILGAAIVLPDHPRIAPASQGNLFDNTEIEEALLLHVHSLTDAERAQAGEDPAVREMIERALAVTPEQIIALHGELKALDADGSDG